MKKMQRKDIPTISVLLACYFYHNHGFRTMPLYLIMLQFNAPEKVAYAAMKREDEKGLIDWGVTLRTAWVTDEGYNYLIENGYYLKNKE